MVAQAQQIKHDEQYPLLKVDTEIGDISLPQQSPSTTISSGWKITCASKRSWLERWPELISACWMTLILLGITLLVFYVLGMSAYRQQPLFIVKCNTSKAENNVYFHYIIPRGNYLSFRVYSDYLSSMAIEYPFLHMNVHFLIDDSLHNYEGSKSSMIFKRFGLNFDDEYPLPMNDKDKEVMNIFKQRYGNVNITIMPLSRYMSLTPLKFKWKMIPIYYLSFYARIFAVWEYGGIGMDLTTFNNQYNNNQLLDRRITAILKQHNDGIEERKYIQTINAINREEESDLFNLFYILMSRIFNNTFSFFDTTPSQIPETTESSHRVVTLSRHYRNKRENARVVVKNSTASGNKGIIANDTLNNTKVLNTIETDLYSILYPKIRNNAEQVKNSSAPQSKTKENSTSIVQNKPKKVYYSGDKQNKINITKLGPELSNFILFYDFSIYSDAIGPPYVFPGNPQPLKQPFKNNVLREPLKKVKTPPYLLSITTDGNFIAATSQHHPFLGHLITSGCKRVNPKYAIENTMLSQCSGLVRDDVYCDNIFVLQ